VTGTASSATRLGGYWTPSSRPRKHEAGRAASQKVPEEDHEWGDVGTAWPGLAERERDAILQPAKPQMQPARDYAGRDAQPEKEYAAAQPESGG
jgi:hypothetical protein